MILKTLDYYRDDERKTYKIRIAILMIIDILMIVSSYSISTILTISHIEGLKFIIPLFIYIIVNSISIGLFNGYRSLWNKSVDREFIQMVIAVLIYQIPISIINKYMGYEFPFLFYIVNMLLTVLATCTSRIGYRVIRKITMYMSLETYTDAKKVLIIGAGSAGRLIIKELYEKPQLQKKPIGIIDDNKNKLGKKIHNIPVIGTCEDIKRIAKDYDIKNIRDVEIEDLLGRETININTKEISNYLENKTILVTGGGGSIGSELCRQIAKVNPKKLILLDIYENNAYEIQQELIRKYKDKLNLEVIVGSIRDEKRLDSIFAKYKPEVVFHAAAHKHVPLMEKSPCEAIKNNVFGTRNVALMADKYKVKRFVLISTDKAVNPTNIMGATKRCAEMIIQTMNEKSKTEFVAVRFGNVLGSNGSVIPLFKKQIEEGGPITVTHPEVTRFFMTIPEAVSLVIQAGAMAKGGEIFVLNMGESVKIVDLAKNLISLSGFEPDVDIKIEFSGLRPGEKLYEELLMDEEGLKQTNHNKIFIGKPININIEKLEKDLKLLKLAVENEEAEAIEYIMKSLVPTFVREEEKLNEAAATI